MKWLPIAIGLLATTPVAAETLFTQSYGGAVSLVPNLTAKVCESSRRAALRMDMWEAIAKANSAPCPSDTSDKGWSAWQEKHLESTGCRTKDGGAAGWG